jgi:hypothetical protein
LRRVGPHAEHSGKIRDGCKRLLAHTSDLRSITVLSNRSYYVLMKI